MTDICHVNLRQLSNKRLIQHKMLYHKFKKPIEDKVVS